MENGSFVFEPVYNVETQGKIDEEFPLIEGKSLTHTCCHEQHIK